MKTNMKNMNTLFKKNVLAELDAERKAELSIEFADKMARLSGTLIKYDKEIDKNAQCFWRLKKNRE